MPHPRNFYFVSEGHFTFEPIGNEKTIHPIDIEQYKTAKIAAHYAYISSELQHIHLKAANIYANFMKLESEYINDIISFCLVRFFSFFRTDAIAVRLDEQKIFRDPGARKFFDFLLKWRDNHLCHNNIWGVDISAGITFDEDGKALNFITTLSVGSWLDQEQVRQIATIFLIAKEWCREKDDKLTKDLVAQVNNGEITIDRQARCEIKTAKLAPWVKI